MHVKIYFSPFLPRIFLSQATFCLSHPLTQTCFEHLALCTNVLRCPLPVRRLTHAPKSDLAGNLSVRQVFIRKPPFFRAVSVLQKCTSYDKLRGTCGRGFVRNPLRPGGGALSPQLAALGPSRGQGLRSPALPAAGPLRRGGKKQSTRRKTRRYFFPWKRRRF